MQKQLFILILTGFVMAQFAVAQTDSIIDFLNKGQKTEKSFAAVDAHLTKNNLEFDNDEQTVKLFNQERIRLGANFETELWKYLGSDLAKHYWISGFVEYGDYLQGNKSLPQLAFKIREKAVELPVANDDYPGKGMKFSMLRDLAVEQYLAGKRDSAIANKRKAESLYREIKDFGVVGATTEYVTCIYDNLEKNTNGCKEEKTFAANTSNSDKGWKYDSGSEPLNAKAVSLPAPEYPKSAKAVNVTGKVEVEVQVDEEGNVYSATALSGHPILQVAAVDAAKKAKFKPMIVDGQVRKFFGTIVYNFSK